MSLSNTEMYPAPEAGMVAHGALRIGPLLTFPDVVSELGGDPDALLAEVGLSRVYFQDPENTIGLRTAGRLLRLARETTRCNHVGLLIGQRTTMSFMGAIGFLMKASPTVGDAWQAVTTYLGVHDRGAVATVEIGPRLTTISYAVQVPGVEDVEQIYSVATAIACNMMREMCGAEWRAEEIQFSFAARTVNLFQKFFRAPILFNAERSCLVISSASLSHPLRTVDPLLHRMMSERMQALAAKGPASMLDRARQQLAKMVLLPGCNAATLANRLGISERTLFRRLADEGASFQSLRDEACRNTAYELLTNTDRRAVDVATILGYSDPAAFTRAFRRWSGTTPAAWRTETRGLKLRNTCQRSGSGSRAD
jgi:AraC-like DNA-binding protein